MHQHLCTHGRTQSSSFVANIGIFIHGYQSGPNATPAASVNENFNLLAAFNKLYQAGAIENNVVLLHTNVLSVHSCHVFLLQMSIKLCHSNPFPSYAG